MTVGSTPRRQDAGQRGAGDRLAPRHQRPRLRPARTLRVVLGLVLVAMPFGVLGMIALMAAGGLVPAANAWLTRSVLNGLMAGHQLGNHEIRHLVVLGVILGVVSLVGGVLPQAQSYIESQARRQISLVFQNRMYQAINSFPGLSRFESPEFHDKIQLSQTTISNSPYQLVGSTMRMGQALITVGSLIGSLATINSVLAAIVVATAVPTVAAELVLSRTEARTQWRTTPANRRQIFYGLLMSDVKAATEVRLFGLGDFLRGRMLREATFVNRARRSADRRVLGAESSLQLLTSAVSAAGLIWAIRGAATGKLSVGDVSLFIAAAAGAQSGISSMVAQLGSVYQSMLVLGHFVDVVSAPPDLPVAAPPRAAPALRGGIEFRDVWFRYDIGLPWVLRGVSMYIPAGKTVALIGLNGAGKSSLVKLLCRMYDPERGSIYWDGVDIRDMSPGDLRARIGTVFQDYMTYDLTAAENIGMGDLDRLDDRPAIRRAAAQAGIDRSLSALPQGYDTMLSRVFFGLKDKENPETGVALSGGQWQRVAVARGLMRADRDLLILDEPSAGLDAEAEHAIHQQLAAVRKDRTSLVISHRLGSVRDADLILVLSRGRIAERGTHQELMAAQGEYSRLFHLQASGYDTAGEPPGGQYRASGRQASALFRTMNGGGAPSRMGAQE
jgi:ATP-binding cassette, subfamily B, bacterial